jgi:predicted adenylyl cyclase CyaB
MARNIEIKARIPGIEALLPLAATLADNGPTPISQDDTFFACPNGRLKLREFADGTGELIFYRRPDQAGPKESFYVRSGAADPASLRQVLSLAHGQAGRVRKHRTLYLIGRTRLHLDRVEGLGDFLELEVVLAEDEPATAGVAEARNLLGKLGIPDTACLEGAYVDLLAQKTERPGSV